MMHFRRPPLFSPRSLVSTAALILLSTASLSVAAFPGLWSIAVGPLGSARGFIAPEDGQEIRARQLPEALVGTTYTWNQTATASWAVSTNWTPTRTTPAIDDVLVFNNGATTTVTNVPAQTVGQVLVSGNTTVNLQSASAVTVTIAGDVGTDLSVGAGSALNCNAVNAITIAVTGGATGGISGSMTFSSAGHRLTSPDAGGITFNSGSVFTAGTSFTGSPFGTTNNSSVVFTSGSTYISRAGANPFGAAAPGSAVVFQSGSLYSHQQTGAPAFSGRTYANFELNVVGTSSGTGSTGVIMDNLTVSQGTLGFGVTSTGHSIKGNISVAAGGTLNFNPSSNATINLNGISTQTISGAGTLNVNGAGTSTFAITNSAGVTLQRNIDVNTGNLFVNSGGRLNCGSFVVAGSGGGAFTLNAGGILGIGSPAGISSTAVSGNITAPNLTFSSGANYVYNGASNQATGTGLPATVNSLTIANTGGPGNNTVTLGSNVTGPVTVATGTLGGAVTLTGAVTVNSGGAIAPGASPGILNTGNTTFTSGSAFNVEIGGTTPGTGHDQLNVTGTVDLGGAALNLTSFGGFTPAAGQTFTITNNDSSDSITGTFLGLAEGATISNFLGSGLNATITYSGGVNSNDVVITVAAAGAPEMNVQGNAIDIADGDTTPRAADGTDFGSIDINGGTQVRTFAIQNTGTADLLLTGIPNKVIIGGTNAADFTVLAPLPTSPVAPAGSTTFQIRFDPAAAGPRSATISIPNNDSDENPYDFVIGGFGASPLAGSVNVGTGQTFTSLTNDGGLFESLNNNGLSGNLTVNITSHLSSETGDHALNQLQEFGGSGYTVTIKPSGGVRNIAGSNFGRLIELNGADRIVIDGFGTANDQFVFVNSSLSGGIFEIDNGATDISILNSTILGDENSTVVNIQGASNITIDNCTIRESPIGTGIPQYLVRNTGSSNLVFTDNTLINFTLAGYESLIGTENTTISGNEISSPAISPNAIRAIRFSGSGTNIISGNKITQLETDGDPATAIELLGLNSGSTTVSGNTIDLRVFTPNPLTGISFDSTGANQTSATVVNNMITIVPLLTTSQQIFGIRDLGGAGDTFNAYFNTVFIGGTASAGNTWACQRGSSSPTTSTWNNNICFNNRTGGSGNHFAMGDQSQGAGTFSGNYNIFVGTGATAANFFDLSTSSTPTPVPFATWQAGTPARDANSQASNPGGNYTVANMFVSTTDLHAAASASNPASNAGTPLGSVTVDFDNETRSATTPDIGADEFTPPAPEINVQGNSTTIVSGDTTPSLADHTDFGAIVLGAGSISRTFTIQNTGTAPLNLTSNPRITISGPHPTNFSLTTDATTPVAAGGSTTFTIDFTPNSADDFFAIVVIQNDDADEGSYFFHIKGTGAGAPEMNVQGNNMDIADGDTTPSLDDDTDFGSADVTGASVLVTYTIENIGTANLDLTGTPSVSISGTHAADFTVSSAPTTPVGPGGSTTFTIEFNPSAAGPRSATISISNNDSDENPYNFAIQGTGTMARTLVVDTTSDSIALNACTTETLGDCSLRGANSVANDGDTVVFDPSVFGLALGMSTITLGGTEIAIVDDITITGPGADQLTIDANNTSRVFNIAAGADVDISGMTITGGNIAGSGGGISNAGILDLMEVVVTDNSASSLGGGILNTGMLTVTASTISANDAGLGAGLENIRFGALAVTATVNSSTISGNNAGSGAGLHNQGATLFLNNSTISGNVANASDPTGGSAGLENVGGGFATDATITNCTFNNNQRTDIMPSNPIADDIYSGNFGFVSTVTVRNSIFGGSSATTAPNLRTFTDGTIPASGVISSGGYNISSDNGSGFLTGTGDQINTDPLLAALADNGGPTLTHKPFVNGPGHDKGCSFGAVVDQRGVARPIDWGNIANASCTVPGENGTDIGAVELLIPTAANASLTGRVITAEGAGIRNAIVTISGGGLAEPRRVQTSSFGYYEFDDLPVGGTYVVTVGSKRFVFSKPSVTVTLFDSVEGIDFVADPLE